MKKRVLFSIFVVVSLCCNAQFVLTPSSGLMTEDGAYTILREGTESENYYAAKKAVNTAFPNADIGELEYEKSFVTGILHKEHGKLPVSGAYLAGDWKIEFKLKIDTSEGKILVSYEEVGMLEWESRKVNSTWYIIPAMGNNSIMAELEQKRYVFNSKGQVAKGCKKTKILFEDVANSIVKEIENNLK